MKQGIFYLSMSVAVALTTLSSGAHSSTFSTQSPKLKNFEAPRIVQSVYDQNLFIVPMTHLGLIERHAALKGKLPDTLKMNHLQLVLKPSASRLASMEAFIAQQHTLDSVNFSHWLTPREFGQAFGVVDADVETMRAWLTAEGFTINTVYPDSLLIDFSGTVGVIRQAFHTQENSYSIGNRSFFANDGDIIVPAAMKNVVSGVIGLSNFGAEAQPDNGKTAPWNSARKGFVLSQRPSGTGNAKEEDGYAIPVPGVYGPARALVPNDMMTMYGIREIRENGIIGTGVTIALVDNTNADSAGWENFVDVFNLSRFGGTLTQVNPQPPSGPSNCENPGYSTDPATTAAEWSSAIAPGANIEIAACSGEDSESHPVTRNIFGGLFIAASNLINGDKRPDVISAVTVLGETYVSTADKTAMDMLWAQADAEGISVFVATGDSGVNVFREGLFDNIDPTIDMNALATSAHVTAVGGTDLADVLDDTTDKYFAATPSIVGGSALSYVPEVAWNESCGNGVAAKSLGFNAVVDFCNAARQGYAPYPIYVDPTAGSGGPSSVVKKPDWQKLVHNAANDTSRDVPDVALFAGSYNQDTFVMTCQKNFPCSSGGGGSYYVEGGTELSTAMFAGIQALMDQGLAVRGLPLDQGNASPVLYTLAASEYGTANGPAPSSLAACDSDNGTVGTAGCVFHNVTRGSISTPCSTTLPTFPETNCYFYYSSDPVSGTTSESGLTTKDANPTHYGVDNKAYGARPGWSFATGLGSVNAKNLLIAWRALLHAKPRASVRQ